MSENTDDIWQRLVEKEQFESSVKNKCEHKTMHVSVNKKGEFNTTCCACGEILDVKFDE